ncbi:MAG: TrkH family potassium uptake protein [Kiritimatiellae bacterium]|nr:TrkH family potassium uptake protein [Kiritimatiellia bacterium]
MSFSAIRMLSAIVGMVAASLLLPLAAAIRYGEHRAAMAFAIPMCASWLVTALLWRRRGGEARPLDVARAFRIVGGAWVAMSLFGALPLYFSGVFPSFTDAVFESVSGFSTTGASVLDDVESIPRSVNLWRCLTHWLGGMGVIMLVVALVPLLGSGGFKLMKAETTGPEKSKVTARVAATAKALWLIYAGFTLVETLLLRAAGMGWFDAVCHSFSTLGTGGFSTRNASVGGFGNVCVEIVVTVFMVVASVNFALYFRLVSGRVRDILRDSELRSFIVILLVTVGLVTIFNVADGATPASSLRVSAFQVASILSTTGFGTSDYTLWRPVAQLLVFALFLIGGCSGSTGGGIKVIRWTVLSKQLNREFRRLLHPREVSTLRINGQPGREEFVPIVASFIFAYLLLVFATAFFGALAGLDLVGAFTGAFSMVGNIGPAFGALGPSANYGFLPAPLKWWYCFAMLAGRLEIYTMLFLVGALAKRARFVVQYRRRGRWTAAARRTRQ